MFRYKSQSQNEEHRTHSFSPREGSGIARVPARSAAIKGGKPRISGGAACLTMTLLAGCAVGPDFLVPAAPDVTGYTKEPLKASSASAGSGLDQNQRFVQDLDIPGQWWATFHSRPLNDLVEDALKHNADLQMAQAALRAAYQTAEATKGAFWPTAGGNYNNFTQKASTVVSPPGNTTGPYLRLYTAQLDISYTPDVFGLVRRGVESAEAQTAIQQYQLEATYLTLTSNVVAAAVQEASLRAQIAATKKIIRIETDLLDLLKRQLALGQVAVADVLVQEAALAASQLTLPPLEKQLALQRDLLTALAGRYPSNEIEEKFTLASLKLPSDLPVSLPSALVEHRPDVKAAEAGLHSASAAIGVAIANRLPVINLTANLSTSFIDLAGLFTPNANAYLLTAAVAQPLFDGFSLYHKQKAAEAAYDQAEASYRSTVITAFQNVADSLRAIQGDARELKAAVHSEDTALKSLNIVRKQAELGLVNSLAILNAQQTYLTALLTRVQAQASRYADTAALFQALGGGWWNRMDVAPNADEERSSGCHDILGPLVSPCVPVPSTAGVSVQPQGEKS
jgi:NodT family efflux transporter outer membrane factor (OMF) lipoprotein